MLRLAILTPLSACMLILISLGEIVTIEPQIRAHIKIDLLTRTIKTVHILDCREIKSEEASDYSSRWTL